MRNSFEEILDICLERIKRGDDLDKILQDYPAHADELREILLLAKRMKDIPSPEPSRRKIATCLLKIGEKLQEQKKQKHRASLSEWFAPPFLIWARALALALIITLISWGTINLSANTVPGDILYPLKSITEKVKFFLTVNPQGKVELRIIYSEERMQELLTLLDKKGNLEPRLLQAMLEEASKALENISRLPKEEKTIYLSRLEYLHAYQKDTLETLQDSVPPPQKKYLAEAIQMCGKQMQQMKMMMGKMHPYMKNSDCRKK
ncbi:MAG: hypothetical protein GXO71_01935 [Caldiserica bacterium]|nr:hypothetical protein [Caldisericota bacterium]